VLFFGLIFSVAPLEIFLPTPLRTFASASDRNEILFGKACITEIQNLWTSSRYFSIERSQD